MSFVTLTKEQFEDILPSEFEQIANTRGTEIIYQIKTEKEGVGVRIYSTVDSLYNETRGKGKDAIRIVFWDCKNGRPLGKGKKVLRVESATTIEDRIKERIDEYLASAKDQEIIDFNYARFILENSTWSDFAKSLLDGLTQWNSLTDKQLAYVLGEVNPKGKMTFETLVKEQMPDIDDQYLVWSEKEEKEDGKHKESATDSGSTANKETTKTNERKEETSRETQEEDNLGLVSGGADKLISTEGYPYKFSHFNKVQSAVYPFKTDDCNVVVGANTSSGKTIAAELIMFEVLKEGKKIIYMSPLKSLSTERFMDWTEGVFSDKKVLMLTGDTLTSKRERDRQMGEANTADVIIMTSELLDSVTRKMMSEKYYWLGCVGLVVTDECVPGHAQVRITPNYQVSIKQVYENPNYTFVLSYNEKNQTLEKKRILRKIRKSYTKNLLRIKYQVEGETKTFVCTSNHKIRTTRGYIQAGQLLVGDQLKILPIQQSNYCEICDKQWSLGKHGRFGGFAAHYYLQHIAGYSFTCNECDRSFRRLEDLKNHKCPWEGSDRFYTQCPICSRKFEFTARLDAHILYEHFACRLHICDVCKSCFKDSITLGLHKYWKHSSKVVIERMVQKRNVSIDHKAKSRAISKTLKASDAHKKAKKEMGKKRRGKNNPIYYHDGQGLKKVKRIGTERWKNLSEEKKQEQIKRFMNAPKYRRGKISSLERCVIEHNFKDLNYTGDGSLFLHFKNGKRKNPDFTVEGQKKVIEVGDFQFWHNWDEANATIHEYNKIGYKCLYLTDEDILENWSPTIDRINTFIQNHDGIVLDIKGFGSGKIKYVYNLEVEDNHNYIADDVLISNCHSIALESRGDVIECALMRFTSLNNKARIVFLSATMPNVGEFQRWVSLLNKKKTAVINCNWRPVKLDIHYMEYPITRSSWGREDYWASQERKRSMVIDIAMSKPNEKFLVFVHDKGTGRDLIKRFGEAGETAHFHNADLDFAQRKEIEGSFMNREGGLRIMVSTSTTAYGRNLPARNVIIAGIHRGINEVDELDIVQELGRAGRIGYDDRGDVYLVIPENSTSVWQEKIKNPRSVTSVINNHHTLAFHVLAEIDNGVIRDAKSLLAWYSRSLAKVQNNELDIKDAQGLLNDLEQMEMVTNKSGIYTLTGLGKVGSWLYFSPYSIHAWHSNFGQMFELGLEHDDLVLAWALTDIPTNDMGYIPKDIQPDCSELQWHLRNKGLLSSNAVVSTLAAYECLRGEGENAAPSVKAGMRGLKFDIERITDAINLIDYNYAKWQRKDLFKVIPIRIAYGIPEQMVGLVSIPGIGGKRARKLWDAGIKSVADAADSESKKSLARLFQPTMVIKIQKEAKRILDKGRG